MQKGFRKIIVLVLLLMSCSVFGQIDSVTAPIKPAKFPGGQKALVRYIMTNISDSLTLIENGQALEKAIVSFYVNENGTVADAKLIKSSKNAAFDRQLLAAFNNMPNWMPAEDRSGKKVKQLKTIPIYRCEN